MKRKLQVFVSSTFEDLQPERQAAVAAILKAGHIPAGMELFTASDQSQMTVIKKWIDESDVYLLILGGRYGSVEPISGISYTELEFDYAVEQRKPLFAIVIKEPAIEEKMRTGGFKFVERERIKELALFRAKVLSNMSSFFEDLKDIRLGVHETLADFVDNPELKGWVQADQIADTKPLFDEITKLSDENKKLRELLSATERREANKDLKFDDLRGVLRAIKVTVPASATGEEKDAEGDLYSLFFANKEQFINGVTNREPSAAAQTFLYQNLSPKLQVHGLMANEKVAGVQYRRYSITPLGTSFLAHEERLILARRAKTTAPASSAAVESLESTASLNAGGTRDRVAKESSERPAAKSTAKKPHAIPTNTGG